MFTGIIETIGEIVSLERRGGDLRLEVLAPALDWSDVALGDSIATNGVCLTAVKLTGQSFVADVSVETLNFSTIKYWSLGAKVNLEKALTPQTRLGGHLVSGHVDGVGEVVKRYTDARSERFTLRAPKELAKYIAHKGSITIDGTSLTVNAVNGDQFELNIVPHTLVKTVIGSYGSGTKVNLEVDVIARYLERLLLGDKAAEANGAALTEAFLADNGYLK
ncbi:riboflavin synthase [Teredinibacter waterburyi]|jgi:riboflavin synthase, alpha subunit|uniref:riboflavin synthase n=1 Tax=Teredinibacter waterburyi TaxID=1500538 RepID=UPI00165ED6D2|nr:riboflavin synthase [Teredinibacter waterburyi]